MADARPAEGEEPALPARRANRPVTIAYTAQYAAARALLSVFRIVGVDRASAIAGGFTKAVGPLIPSISRRGDANLRLIFPEWDDERRKEVLAGVWENLGRMAAEFAHLDKFDPSDPNGRLEFAGAEHFVATGFSGKPVIFVSGHFANWEIMTVALQHTGLKFGLVYRAANNPLVDELIIKTRGKSMSRVQVPKGDRGVRSLIDMVRAGSSLAMLVDQKLNEGITVPFLGRPAKTATAAARLALRFSAPVVPASIERLEGARFRVTIQEPIHFAPTGDFSADIIRLTTLINERIGKVIMERPEQWLWFHRRWPKEAYEELKKRDG
jgi:KDO2-lipid IV(A) lauroyltransferase